MLKVLVKALREPSVETVRDLHPILQSKLLKARASEKAIDDFVKDVSKTGNLQTSLKKLFPDLNFGSKELSAFEHDLIKLNAKLYIGKHFEHSLLKELGLEAGKIPKNEVNEIQTLIETNSKLKNYASKFISIVNNNKLKLSLVALTVGGLAEYLTDAAKNVSGCYKYDNKSKAICKVKKCIDDVSITSSFCKESEINNIGNCNETCDEKLNCKSVDSKSLVVYHCLHAKWFDVLGLILKRDGNSFINVVWKFFKYFILLLVGYTTFMTFSHLNIFPRLGLTLSSVAVSLVYF